MTLTIAMYEVADLNHNHSWLFARDILIPILRRMRPVVLSLSLYSCARKDLPNSEAIQTSSSWQASDLTRPFVGPSLSSEARSRWKLVDQLLVLNTVGTDITVNISWNYAVEEPVTLPPVSKYGCMQELVTELLPMLTARKDVRACKEFGCIYHV